MMIAFFDFDGTITTKDSLIEFIKYAVGKPKYYWGLLVLSPVLVLYTFKLLPNNIAKEKLIAYYFKNWPENKLKQTAQRYSQQEINKIVRPKAIKKIEWHLAQGHEVVLVSASMECWLAAWCQLNGLKLIGTQLEYKDGAFTGRFASNNCYGINKVKRIKMQYNLNNYQDIYAYGDSSGDKEMLAIADHAFYKPFR